MKPTCQKREAVQKKSARPQLSVKKLQLFVLLRFDAEVFKTCKNTIKLINLCDLALLLVVEYMTLAAYDSVL